MPPRSRFPRQHHVLILGTGAAVILTAYLLPWRLLNPLDTSWLVGDPATGYLGWLFLRAQDSLGWPLGLAHDLGAPLGKPIALLDANPLVATLLWPFRSMLPESFQYFGMLFLLHCVLQFYFGYRISLHLMDGAPRAALLGGLFFLTAPVFILRSLGHFALSAHWLVLAAFVVFFSPLLRTPIKGVAVSSLLAAIAGGTNPYITYMVLLVIGAAYLKLILDAPRDDLLRTGGVAVLSMLAVTTTAVCAWLLFGFVDLADPGATVGAGSELYSMDLLALINPMGHTSLLLPRISVGPGQHEGYNYLGLGVLGLGVASLAFRPDLLRKLLRRSAIPAWTVLLVSLALALSTKATAAGIVIYQLTLPTQVLSVLDALRGSGRLFWPAFYLVMAAVLYAGYTTFYRRIVPILALAFLVQVLDTRSLYASIRSQWEAAQSAVFTDREPWQSLAARHRHLVVIPPWQCDPHRSPGGANGFWIFGKLAGERGMSINSFYASRFGGSQARYFCEEQPRQIEAAGLRSDTAYVFSERGNLIGIRPREHACRKVDGVILCSRDPGAGAQAGLSWPPFPVGTTSPLSTADDRIAFDGGWHAPEAWGRWTGSASRLSVSLQEPAKEIVLQAFPFLAGPIKSQRILATINGTELPVQALAKEDRIILPIPDGLGAVPGEILLSMRFPDASSPASLGLWRDTRVFAVGVKSITVR